eukprot:Pgem_evm1s20293
MLFSYKYYKNHYTAKVLVFMAPTGHVIYATPPYGGRISDNDLTAEYGWIFEKLWPGARVMADKLKGFTNGANLVLEDQVDLPAFLKKDQQFSQEEKLVTKEVASTRIYVERLYSELCGTGASVTVYPDDHVEYTESESPSILSQNPSQNISKKKEKKQYDYIVVEEHFTQNDIRSLQYIYSSVKDGNSFSDKNSFDNSASQGSTSSSSQRKRKDGLFVKKSWLVNCLKKNEILPWYGYAIAGNTYFKNHIFILDGVSSMVL